MTKSQLFFMILSGLSGLLIPVQAATNAAFSKATHNAVITTVMVLGVALAAVSVYAMLSRTALREMTALKQAPVYGWFGGLIVAFYVITITLATPRLGVGTAIGLIITGQIVGAILIDHFGLFGVAVKSIDMKRLAGALCMVVGIYLVMKK